MYVVYVLQNLRGKLYTGHTNNLDRRLYEHNNNLSVYTRKTKGPWKLIYKENYLRRCDAMRREKELKTGKGRDFLKKFISIVSGQSSPQAN